MLASTHAADLGKESWMLDNAFLVLARASQDRAEFCDWLTPPLPVPPHPCSGTLVQGRIPLAAARSRSTSPSSVLFTGWPQKAGRDLGFPCEAGHGKKRSQAEGHGQSPVIRRHRHPARGRRRAAVRGKLSMQATNLHNPGPKTPRYSPAWLNPWGKSSTVPT